MNLSPFVNLRFFQNPTPGMRVCANPESTVNTTGTCIFLVNGKTFQPLWLQSWQDMAQDSKAAVNL